MNKIALLRLLTEADLLTSGHHLYIKNNRLYLGYTYAISNSQFKTIDINGGDYIYAILNNPLTTIVITNLEELSKTPLIEVMDLDHKRRFNDYSAKIYGFHEFHPVFYQVNRYLLVVALDRGELGLVCMSLIPGGVAYDGDPLMLIQHCLELMTPLRNN